MKMICILDREDVAQWVNPEYVTAIETETFSGRSWRKVWVIGGSGYNTISICTSESGDDLAIRLQKGV